MFLDLTGPSFPYKSATSVPSLFLLIANDRSHNIDRWKLYIYRRERVDKHFLSAILAKSYTYISDCYFNDIYVQNKYICTSATRVSMMCFNILLEIYTFGQRPLSSPFLHVLVILGEAHIRYDSCIAVRRSRAWWVHVRRGGFAR